ncbi:uncharacterized protein METZ01_LOCUS504245, partial [marine metagenome]
NSIDRQIGFLTKKAKSNERGIKEELNLLTRLLNNLSDGIAVRDANFTDVDENRIRLLNLLSAKPILYVCNVGEKAAGTGNELSERVAAYADQKGTGFVFISAKIEAEISQLRDEHEKIEFLETIGLKETGLARLIQAGYSLLNLITYYTAGPNEARAWTVAQGTRAHEAAGRIHSDFERGFICAETITGSDYLSLGGEAAARLEGKLRQEGKDYIIQEGDVILYRFNV